MIDTWTFVTGIITGILGNAVWDSLRRRVFAGSQTPEFTVGGTWLASFTPLSPRPSHSIELLTIHQRCSDVRLRLENYNDCRTSVLRLRGNGNCRGSQIAANYFLTEEGKHQIGALVLRCRLTNAGHGVLVGAYMEYVDRVGVEGPDLLASGYILHRVQLPMRAKWRRLAHRTSFPDFASVVDWAHTAGVDLQAIKKETEVPTKGSTVRLSRAGPAVSEP